MTELLTATVTSELVWDAAARATAASAGTEPVHIGGLDGWSPEGLLATAVAASVMTRFLALAADDGLEVLGYVSCEAAAPGDGGTTPYVDIAPCIVVGSEADAARARTMFETAVDEAEVARALRHPIRTDVRVSVVAEARERPSGRAAKGRA
jgi:organic hydroperoxide reductase OsmC/OhrA